jgi:hypothetical protein
VITARHSGDAEAAPPEAAMLGSANRPGTQDDLGRAARVWSECPQEPATSG